MIAVIDDQDHRTEHPTAEAAIAHARRFVRASPQYWNRTHNHLIAGVTVTVAHGTAFVTLRPQGATHEQPPHH